MRNLLAILIVASPLTLLPAVSGAKGCLKGAAVGGVVGHVAGHHAVLGAAAGCVIEHHREKARDKAAQQSKSGVPRHKAPADGPPQRLAASNCSIAAVSRFKRVAATNSES